MEKNTDSFEEKWQDAFNNASIEPSGSVWEGIEKGIAAAPSSLPVSKDLSKFYTGTAFVAVLGVATWFVLQKNTFTEKNDTILQKAKKEIKIENATNIDLNKETLFTKTNTTNVEKPTIKENNKIKIITAQPLEEEYVYPCDLPVDFEKPINKTPETVPEPILPYNSAGLLPSKPIEMPKIEVQSESLETETYYKEMPKKVETVKEKPKIKVGFGIGIY